MPVEKNHQKFSYLFLDSLASSYKKCSQGPFFKDVKPTKPLQYYVLCMYFVAVLCPSKGRSEHSNFKSTQFVYLFVQKLVKYSILYPTNHQKIKLTGFAPTICFFT